MRYLFFTTLIFCFCDAPTVSANQDKKPAVADEKEKQAVAAMKKLGWRVLHSSDKEDAPVVKVFIEGRKVQGADLQHLAALPELEVLIFFTVTIEGQGLKYLKDLKKLGTLSLGFTTIPSEKTWDDLKELKQLKQIGMGYTTIAGKKEPHKKIKEVLPQVKIIGPLPGEEFRSQIDKELQEDRARLYHEPAEKGLQGPSQWFREKTKESPYDVVLLFRISQGPQGKKFLVSILALHPEFNKKQKSLPTFPRFDFELQEANGKRYLAASQKEEEAGLAKSVRFPIRYRLEKDRLIIEKGGLTVRHGKGVDLIDIRVRICRANSR